MSYSKIQNDVEPLTSEMENILSSCLNIAVSSDKIEKINKMLAKK